MNALKMMILAKKEALELKMNKPWYADFVNYLRLEYFHLN